IHKNAVMVFPVGPQRLAVIGGHRDDRSVVKTERFELLKERSQRRIHIRDLAVVERFGISRFIRLWRVVGIVWIVEMDPKKKWAGRTLVEPRQGVRHGLAPSALVGLVASLRGIFFPAK